MLGLVFFQKLNELSVKLPGGVYWKDVWVIHDSRAGLREKNGARCLAADTAAHSCPWYLDLSKIQPKSPQRHQNSRCPRGGKNVIECVHAGKLNLALHDRAWRSMIWNTTGQPRCRRGDGASNGNSTGENDDQSLDCHVFRQSHKKPPEIFTDLWKMTHLQSFIDELPVKLLGIMISHGYVNLREGNHEI